MKLIIIIIFFCMYVLSLIYYFKENSCLNDDWFLDECSRLYFTQILLHNPSNFFFFSEHVKTKIAKYLNCYLFLLSTFSRFWHFSAWKTKGFLISIFLIFAPKHHTEHQNKMNIKSYFITSALPTKRFSTDFRFHKCLKNP